MATLVCDFETVLGKAIKGYATISAGETRVSNDGRSVVLADHDREEIINGRCTFDNVDPGPFVLTVSWSGRSVTIRGTMPQTTSIRLSDLLQADYLDKDGLQKLRQVIDNLAKNTLEQSTQALEQARQEARKAATESRYAAQDATRAEQYKQSAETASNEANRAADRVTRAVQEFEDIPRDVSFDGDVLDINGVRSPSLTGPQGPEGPRGEQGPPGPKGDKGDPGPSVGPDSVTKPMLAPELRTEIDGKIDASAIGPWAQSVSEDIEELNRAKADRSDIPSVPPHSSLVESDALVQRDSGGQVMVPKVPDSDDAAASKAYVDSQTADAGDYEVYDLNIVSYRFEPGSGDRANKVVVKPDGTGFIFLAGKITSDGSVADIKNSPYRVRFSTGIGAPGGGYVYISSYYIYAYGVDTPSPRYLTIPAIFERR